MKILTLILKNWDQILEEIDFQTSRSGGPGGQSVNKTESKVTLLWNLRSSKILNEDQRLALESSLGNRVNKVGFLNLSCEKFRSQKRNKDEILKILRNLLVNSLTPPKARKKTSIPKSVRLKNYLSKTRHGQKKNLRKKPEF